MKSRRRWRWGPGLAFWSLLITLAILTGCAAGGGGAGRAAWQVDEGRIGKARFRLLVPDQWSGNVLILAHGWRPPKTRLIPGLEPDDPFVARLLAEGWLVAATSYRRNGLVIADGLTDLEDLADAIERKYGPCRRILVEGTSMGANIALLLAEQTPTADSQSPAGSVFDGVIAVGAAPDEPGEDGPLEWTFAPHLPVILLSNRSEIAPVCEYARQTPRGRHQPAVWVLERDGHVNLNADERLAAVAALTDWTAPGPRPAGTWGAPYDATVDRTYRVPLSSSETADGRRGRILAVDPVYGNLTTDLVAADLAALGIGVGDAVRVTCGEMTRKAHCGTTYADVDEGDLVVFLTAEGLVEVAVNGGSAARRLRTQATVPLEIAPWVDPTPPPVHIRH